MTKFKVNDKVRFISNPWKFNEDVTKGKIYGIHKVDGDGDAFFEDDSGGTSFISDKNAHLFELVTEPTPVEASATVIELLANISRRLYEAERTIKSQAYEINELYKAVADRG